jgi:hypothetical protein
MEDLRKVRRYRILPGAELRMQTILKESSGPLYFKDGDTCIVVDAWEATDKVIKSEFLNKVRYLVEVQTLDPRHIRNALIDQSFVQEY